MAWKYSTSRSISRTALDRSGPPDSESFTAVLSELVDSRRAGSGVGPGLSVGSWSSRSGAGGHDCDRQTMPATKTGPAGGGSAPTERRSAESSPEVGSNGGRGTNWRGGSALETPVAARAVARLAILSSPPGDSRTARHAPSYGA